MKRSDGVNIVHAMIWLLGAIVGVLLCRLAESIIWKERHKAEPLPQRNAEDRQEY